MTNTRQPREGRHLSPPPHPAAGRTAWSRGSKTNRSMRWTSWRQGGNAGARSLVGRPLAERRAAQAFRVQGRRHSAPRGFHQMQSCRPAHRTLGMMAWLREGTREEGKPIVMVRNVVAMWHAALPSRTGRALGPAGWRTVCAAHPPGRTAPARRARAPQGSRHRRTRAGRRSIREAQPSGL